MAGVQSSSLLKIEYERWRYIVPPLEPSYVGPYKVIQPGPKLFHWAVGAHEETVVVNRLKPHLGLDPLLPANWGAMVIRIFCGWGFLLLLQTYLPSRQVWRVPCGR